MILQSIAAAALIRRRCSEAVFAAGGALYVLWRQAMQRFQRSDGSEAEPNFSFF